MGISEQKKERMKKAIERIGKEKINLTEEEIKSIKKQFKEGKVHTDGCFCGHAVANFRDNLYVLIDFSCRKSMSCDNPYYNVLSIEITEKALVHHTKEEVLEMLEKRYEDDFEKISDKKLVLVNDDYNDPTEDDLHYVREDIEFDKESLRAIQKKLFKYYKKTYGYSSDAKFKDVGFFNY